MWDKLLKLIPAYSPVVFNAIDESGYPFSMRCRPVLDEKEKVLRIPASDYLKLQAGAASLLCHYHDEQLWNLTSFVVRGHIEIGTNEYIFHPTQFIDGAGTTFKHQIRVIQEGRSAAKKYLEKRGLPRPKIPWDEVKARYRRAQES